MIGGAMFFRDVAIITVSGAVVVLLAWWLRPKIDRFFLELKELVENPRDE